MFMDPPGVLNTAGTPMYNDNEHFGGKVNRNTDDSLASLLREGSTAVSARLLYGSI